MSEGKAYGIIVLAAGNSSRMGQPKQLLVFRNISLLQNVVGQAKKIEDAIVAVVTGASQVQVENDVAEMDVLLFHNDEWETGMASSIRVGVEKLAEKFPELEAVILTVCDQPFLTSDIFSSLIREYILSDKGIVASSYNDAVGTPVLFSREYFPELIQLEGQEGAKKVIILHEGDSVALPFPEGETDIDTMQDYEILFS